jgi:hypothetical protein
VGKAHPNASLLIVQGSQNGEEFQILSDSTTLGRGQKVDVFFHDPEASREHARINWDNGGFTLVDQGSSNGTFVNGGKVMGSQELNDGDLITIGETVLEFRSTGEIVDQGNIAVRANEEAPRKSSITTPGKGNSSKILVFGGVAVAAFVCVVSAILVGAFVIIPALKPDSPVVIDIPSVAPGMAYVEILNQHSEDVCGIALSPSDSEEWGENWMPEGEILSSGSSITFSIESGITYDFAAITCSEAFLPEQYGIPIQDGTNTIVIQPGN